MLVCIILNKKILYTELFFLILLINMKVGNNIYASNGMWNFGNNVADSFVKHISLSVPFYKDGQEIICDLIEFFIKPNQIHYELGSSTGELTKMLSERHSHKDNALIVGIDSQLQMIKKLKNIVWKLNQLGLIMQT